MLARGRDPRTQEPSGQFPPHPTPIPTVGAGWDTSEGHCAGLAFSTSILSLSTVMPSKPTQPLGSRGARTWAAEDGARSSEAGGSPDAAASLAATVHTPPRRVPGRMGPPTPTGAQEEVTVITGVSSCQRASPSTPQLSPVAQSPRKPHLGRRSPGQLGGSGSPALRRHDSRPAPGAWGCSSNRTCGTHDPGTVTVPEISIPVYAPF